MKKQLLTTMLIGILLAACQSQDLEPPMPEADDPQPVVEEIEATPISEDVNSAEVKNILGSLFGKERGRSSDYTVSLLKDKEGKDRVICVNYADNGGFALISAEKTHTPILAYAEEGNFTNTDDLPFPLNEWMESTMEGIADSETLPADSLQKISYMWRKYEHTPMPLVDDYPPDRNNPINISWEEYQRLSRIMMDQMREWTEKGYRFYHIENYHGTTSHGDNEGINSYVKGVIYPAYMDDSWLLTFIVEKDIEYTTGKGHWMNTEWQQTNGYNQSFEFKSDNPKERIPVGCGPIAVGQVMYAYKYPSYFNWNAMTISGYANKVISDFLLDVKNKCKAKYNPKTGGTGCTQNNMVDALRGFGYACDNKQQINFIHMLNNPSILISNLNWTNQDGEEIPDCHAWIVEGGRCTVSYMDTEIWTFSSESNFECVNRESSVEKYSSWLFYVNWGWGYPYACNAYYDLSPMIPSGLGYHSNTILSGIQNIRPF